MKLNTIIEKVKGLAHSKGYKLEFVSTERISTLQDELQKFNAETELNGFQKWIVNQLYKFTLPEQTRSVIIAAVPFPAAYANVTFVRSGKEYRIYGLVPAPLHIAEKVIKSFVQEAGYEIHDEPNLPLKRC